MKILIPMAGAGSRFAEKGYTQHKPVIPTTDRRTGQKVPMVVAAVSDLPFDPKDPKNEIIFVVRDFHEKDGVTEEIKAHYPSAKFIVIDKLTEGQASTCLLARDFVDNDEPLLIAACDNGMALPKGEFEKLSAGADALLFSFRHNEAVCEKPQAYGWIKTKGIDVTGVSVKVPISETPMEDHAIVGTFWFCKGSDFVKAADAMIAANDRINGEFYVDQVFKYLVETGLKVQVLETDRYICWGTPNDYESYEKTIAYWRDYATKERAAG